MEFDVKKEVKKYYGDIAKEKNKSSGKGSCCSSCCCGSTDISSLIYDSRSLEGLPEEVTNASLGCANPLASAGLKEGDVVLDLGSGGGIDALMASRYVGDSGRVYGLDMTDEMLHLANRNKEKMGVENVEFIKGYIEDIPLEDESVDVVISNCVINLCEDKRKAVSEIYRVLKKGGRLSIADVVALKEVPAEIREEARLWSACIAGALEVEECKRILEEAGFSNIEIEPVHIYTKQYIEDLIERSSLQKEDIDIDLLDGAFAGATIKALK